MKYLIKAGFIILGATLGFLYYKFIGCRSGVCPITSNPWISTGYGALFGLILSMNSSRKKQSEEQEAK